METNLRDLVYGWRKPQIVTCRRVHLIQAILQVIGVQVAPVHIIRTWSHVRARIDRKPSQPVVSHFIVIGVSRTTIPHAPECPRRRAAVGAKDPMRARQCWPRRVYRLRQSRCQIRGFG